MTLSATVVGFAIGALFGILLAVLIVHLRTLEKSLLPWVICSQMVPILAIAPIVIVVFGAIGIRGLLPKSIISAYLCFFPVTIGMVKGLTSPDPHATRSDAHLVGEQAPGLLQAALAVLRSVPVRKPEGFGHDFSGRRHRRGIADRRAGRHRRAAVAGSYYGQTVQIWAALVAAAIISTVLIAIIDAGRAVGGVAHGSIGMIPRGQAIGFWIAALALLAALALPLAGNACPGCHRASVFARRGVGGGAVVRARPALAGAALRCSASSRPRSAAP